MQPKAIAINYLKTWFIMDLIASVPIDLILAIIEAELLKNAATKNMDQTELAYLTKLFKMMRLIRMLKLIRLFRLSRVAKYIRSLRLWLQHHFDFSIPQAFLKISKLVILLVIVAHWLGCIFFMVNEMK
jgi:hyperpolarization activated cyclic nucleotide-gated potassium channel 2